MMLLLSVLRNDDDLNVLLPLVIVEITISPTIGKEIILLCINELFLQMRKVHVSLVMGAFSLITSYSSEGI